MPQQQEGTQRTSTYRTWISRPPCNLQGNIHGVRGRVGAHCKPPSTRKVHEICQSAAPCKKQIEDIRLVQVPLMQLGCDRFRFAGSDVAKRKAWQTQMGSGRMQYSRAAVMLLAMIAALHM